METRCRSRRAADAAALAMRPLSWDQVNTAALDTLRRLFPVGADSGGYPVCPLWPRRKDVTLAARLQHRMVGGR